MKIPELNYCFELGIGTVLLEQNGAKRTIALFFVLLSVAKQEKCLLKKAEFLLLILLIFLLFSKKILSQCSEPFIAVTFYFLLDVLFVFALFCFSSFQQQKVLFIVNNFVAR